VSLKGTTDSKIHILTFSQIMIYLHSCPEETVSNSSVLSPVPSNAAAM